MALAAGAVHAESSLLLHLPFDTSSDATAVLERYRELLDGLQEQVWTLITPARRAGVLASLHPDPTERTEVAMAWRSSPTTTGRTGGRRR
jgi:hypothetical protein